HDWRARARRNAAAAVAAQAAEREIRGAGGIRRRHSGMRVLLEIEWLGPAMLDRVAEAVERADSGVAAPGEDETAGAAHADQLVVDHVRSHPHERQLAALLTDQLVTGRVRDQVREAFEGDGVTVAHELVHRVAERDDHACSPSMTRCATAKAEFAAGTPQ